MGHKYRHGPPGCVRGWVQVTPYQIGGEEGRLIINPLCCVYDFLWALSQGVICQSFWRLNDLPNSACNSAGLALYMSDTASTWPWSVFTSSAVDDIIRSFATSDGLLWGMNSDISGLRAIRFVSWIGQEKGATASLISCTAQCRILTLLSNWSDVFSSRPNKMTRDQYPESSRLKMSEAGMELHGITAFESRWVYLRFNDYELFFPQWRYFPILRASLSKTREYHPLDKTQRIRCPH